MLIPMKRPLDGLDEGREKQCIAERPPKRSYKTDDPDYITPSVFTALEAPSQRYISNCTSLAFPSTAFGLTCTYEDQFYDAAALVQRDYEPLGTYQESYCDGLSTDGAEQNCLSLEAHGYQDRLDINSKEAVCIDIADFSLNGTAETGSFSYAQQDHGSSLPWCDGFVDEQDENDSDTVTNTRGLTPQYGLTMDPDVIEDAVDSDSYDTCLGHVLLEDIPVRSNFLKPKEKRSILLEIRGDVVILREPESNAYVGLLNSKFAPVIISLLASHKVTVAATLHSINKLDILFYTTNADCAKVGDFLSERDWYLQQPSSYDTSTTYHNPQWLTRPGEEFEPTHIETQPKLVRGGTASLDEKTKIDEVLDSATGPVEFKRARVTDLLVTPLKEHQIKALSMMHEKESGMLRGTEFPCLWSEVVGAKPAKYINNVMKTKIARRPQLCLGGLLADDMGLGKTLTVLALIAGSFSQTKARSYSVPRATLVVTPLSTLPHWEDQIQKHLKPGSATFTTYHGPARRDSALLEGFDIVLTTYDILRAEWPGLKRPDKRKTSQLGLLHSIDWHRLVLDEAHVIRNRKQAFWACRDVKAVHRWCLTGTPIQNTVEDLGALVEFLRVDPFDRRDAFKNSFIDHASGKVHSWERLRALVQAISLRRTKASVGAELDIPPKQEIIQPIILNENERHAYDMIKGNCAVEINSGKWTRNALNLILRLRQVCNHGRDLLPKTTQEWLEKARLYSDQFVPLILTCESCDSTIGDSEPNGVTLPCLHQICKVCVRSKDADDGKCAVCPICNTLSLATDYEAGSITSNPRMRDDVSYRPSSKVLALLRNLRNDNESSLPGQVPPKSVVFSTWTSMLDLVGRALTMNGIGFQRLDGSRSLTQRREAISGFRNDPRCTVLLATLGCAGVGLDLTMASRVHLMEPSWNPMLERQALDRVHRLGQSKEVIATRYIVAGSDSIEEHILRVQKRKSEAIAASFNEANPSRDFAIRGFLKPLYRASRSTCKVWFVDTITLML